MSLYLTMAINPSSPDASLIHHFSILKVVSDDILAATTHAIPVLSDIKHKMLRGKFWTKVKSFKLVFEQTNEKMTHVPRPLSQCQFTDLR